MYAMGLGKTSPRNPSVWIKLSSGLGLRRDRVFIDRLCLTLVVLVPCYPILKVTFQANSNRATN